MTSFLAQACVAATFAAQPAFAYWTEARTPRPPHPHFQPVIELTGLTEEEVCRMILMKRDDLLSASDVPAPLGQ